MTKFNPSGENRALYMIKNGKLYLDKIHLFPIGNKFRVDTENFDSNGFPKRMYDPNDKYMFNFYQDSYNFYKNPKKWPSHIPFTD